MGQITATRNLVATKVVRHAGQQDIQTPILHHNGPSMVTKEAKGRLALLSFEHQHDTKWEILL